MADFFSGVGGVARSVRRMGFQAREWEMLNGDCYDLTRPCVLRHIEQDASKQKLLAAMLAPPCGSFSGINRFAHRSRNDPWASQVQHATPYMVESVATEEAPKDTILEVIERGWEMDGETVRLAKVKVSSGPPAAEEPPPAEEEAAAAEEA